MGNLCSKGEGSIEPKSIGAGNTGAPNLTLASNLQKDKEQIFEDIAKHFLANRLSDLVAVRMSKGLL